MKRKTAKHRLSRSLRTISDWCRANLHEPLNEQHEALSRKLQGHYGYYGIIGNYKCLNDFRLHAKRIWLRWLSRRSDSRSRSWAWFAQIEKQFPLPTARVVHSLARRVAKS